MTEWQLQIARFHSAFDSLVRFDAHSQLAVESVVSLRTRVNDRRVLTKSSRTRLRRRTICSHRPGSNTEG
jgi:hypothetical protein